MLTATMLLTYSCKKDNDDDTPDSNKIGTDGGIFKIGETEIFFPEGSVSEEVLIEGSIEDSIILPEHITILGDIHKIQLSNPDAYEPNTATISIVHNDDTEVSSIFVSSDGITWTDLRGYKNDKHIVASIPHFSYFFAGNATYSIIIKNNTMEMVGYVQYQFDENICNLEAYPLAMNSGYLQVMGQTLIQWNESFNFWWGNSGTVEVGNIITAEEEVQTDQSTNNQISLSYNGSTYQFSNQVAGPVAGPLTIVQENSIPINQIASGIGFENTPVYAVQGIPGTSAVFNITSNEYFISMGYASVGEVLNIYEFPSSTSIIFPTGEYHADVSMNSDGTYTVSYY